MVRASVLASSVSWVRIPPEQLFFLFGEKRVVWVSCLPLFSIYRKEFSWSSTGVDRNGWNFNLFFKRKLANISCILICISCVLYIVKAVQKYG